MLIEELSQDAIRSIERRMRPRQYSTIGFLNNEERLVDVIARDMQTLSDLSVTPEAIADRLESIASQAMELMGRGAGRLPLGLPEGTMFDDGGWQLEGYLVAAASWLGYQLCPFEDGDGNPCNEKSYGCSDFFVRNTQTQDELRFPGLAIHLIRDHHFFEGTVAYRVDPASAVAVLGLSPG